MVRGETGYMGKMGKTGIRVRVRVRYAEFQNRSRGAKVGTRNRNVTEITQGLLQQKWDKEGQGWALGNRCGEEKSEFQYRVT